VVSDAYLVRFLPPLVPWFVRECHPRRDSQLLPSPALFASFGDIPSLSLVIRGNSIFSPCLSRSPFSLLQTPTRLTRRSPPSLHFGDLTLRPHRERNRPSAPLIRTSRPVFIRDGFGASANPQVGGPICVKRASCTPPRPAHFLLNLSDACP